MRACADLHTHVSADACMCLCDCLCLSFMRAFFWGGLIAAGTPQYMAPELLKNTKFSDKSDVRLFIYIGCTCACVHVCVRAGAHVCSRECISVCDIVCLCASTRAWNFRLLSIINESLLSDPPSSQPCLFSSFIIATMS